MINDEQKQNLIKLGMGLVAGVTAYYLFKGDKPVTAVKKTVKNVIDVPSKIVKEVKDTVKEVTTNEKPKRKARFEKGSQEAKDYMASLRKKQTGKRKPKNPKVTGHKGHATKKGLVQDQNMISDEPHEKAYQHKKRRESMRKK